MAEKIEKIHEILRIRELLRRGKRADTGEWIKSFNYLFFLPENGEILCYMPKMCEKCKCEHDENDNIVSMFDCICYKVIPETIGRCTNMTDINGKEIFEGDIIQCNDDPKQLVKVVFGEFDVVLNETEETSESVIGIPEHRAAP